MIYLFFVVRKNVSELSINFSIHCKSRDIYGPYNFLTPIKSSIPDVWNLNSWALFILENEVRWGGGERSEGWALTTLHLLRWLSSCTCTCHIIKPSKLQKHVFYHYKVWERKLVSVCFFEKVKTPKRTLEIDDLELPSGRKFSSCYEEGETPVEFTSTVEEYYPQNFYSAEVLL